jgi:hypothetical protein
MLIARRRALSPVAFSLSALARAERRAKMVGIEKE